MSGPDAKKGSAGVAIVDEIRWLTERQARDVMKRDGRTLRRWRAEGEVNAYAHGKFRLYDRAELEDCAITQAIRYTQRQAGRKPNSTK